MSPGASFEKLKKFLEEKPASRKAIKNLKSGVEIGVVIGHQMECAYFKKDDAPCFELRAAQNPDVIFTIKPESVDILTQNSGEDVGELGIAVLKEYMSGGVRIRAPGSIWNISTNGYLGIIKEGGSTFMKFLTQHGVASIGKILSIIKDLKKNPS